MTGRSSPRCPSPRTWGSWETERHLHAQVLRVRRRPLPSPGSGNQPYSVSPEGDGATWTAYKGGTQKFGNGPLVMEFDPVNRIMYSANWQWGIWALKVVDP